MFGTKLLSLEIKFGLFFPGVPHGEEAFYVFYPSFIYKLLGFNFNPTNEQRTVIGEWATWLSNFARTGYVSFVLGLHMYSTRM